MKDYKHAVYIGRFQPFHNAHLQVVENGLSIADQVIIFVGSANSARTIKNPFSYQERKEMIQGGISGDRYYTNARVKIFPLRDYYYNDNAWLSDIQAKTDTLINEGDSVVLLGSYKDSSSQYLKLFPQWDFETCRTEDISATEIRELLLDQKMLEDWEGKPSEGSLKAFDWPWRELKVPEIVDHKLYAWMNTKSYMQLNKEFHFIQDYRKQWEDSPFPPTFVTTDCVVICSGHVLVVKRKFNPGKGLYALPGGFVKQNEFIQDAALRELKEETGIRVDKIILESSIKDRYVFDHPDRSLRGRTISHGFLIKLKDGKLPEVKGNDDADKAMWMPLWDAIKQEDQFFEDHIHIIQKFVGV